MAYNPESPQVGGNAAIESWNIVRAQDSPLSQSEVSPDEAKWDFSGSGVIRDGDTVIFYDHHVEEYPGQFADQE